MREALMRVAHDRLAQNASLLQGWGRLDELYPQRTNPIRGGLHAQTSLA